MKLTSCPGRLAVLLFVVVAAGCSRTSADAALESALPVQPGVAWEDGRAALARLDAQVQDKTGVSGRAATVKADVLVAGYHFDEVMITGVAGRATVRSVRLATKPPADCDKARADLIRALGSAWDAGATHMGATDVAREGRMARIVCTKSELSISILG